MARVQIDSIDMRTRLDVNSDGKTYKWILQLKDHFSIFCWARPLQKKEAREVYQCIRDIFFQFEPPHIRLGTGPAGPVRSSPVRSNFPDRPVFTGFYRSFLKIFGTEVCFFCWFLKILTLPMVKRHESERFSLTKFQS
jgi:hypothetical protein